MKRIDKDIEDILSIDEKTAILKELHQEDLIDLFKNKYQPKYTPIAPKKAALDQQISIAIAQDEKDYIGKELLEIRKAGPKTSISSFIRNRAVSQVDIADWYERALVGLKTLTSASYDPEKLNKQKSLYLKMLEDIDPDNKEDNFLYNKKLDEIDERLDEIARIKPKRVYRLTGRVTFNEANIIRWRAARLNITIADYMRFQIFGYKPFTAADQHLTVDTRKRLYISIIDVYNNGWGDPPKINECPNCARYIHDIEVLKKQLERLQEERR